MKFDREGLWPAYKEAARERLVFTRLALQYAPLLAPPEKGQKDTESPEVTDSYMRMAFGEKTKDEMDAWVEALRGIRYGKKAPGNKDRDNIHKLQMCATHKGFLLHTYPAGSTTAAGGLPDLGAGAGTVAARLYNKENPWVCDEFFPRMYGGIPHTANFFPCPSTMNGWFNAIDVDGVKKAILKWGATRKADGKIAATVEIDIYWCDDDTDSMSDNECGKPADLWATPVPDGWVHLTGTSRAGRWMNGYQYIKIGAGGWHWEEAGEGNPGKWPGNIFTAYKDRDMDQTVRQLDQGDGNGNPDLNGAFDRLVAEKPNSEHNALAAAARVGSETVPTSLAAGEWELQDPFPEASDVFPSNDADEGEDDEIEEADEMDVSNERLHPALERLIARLNDDLDALAIISKDGRRERPSLPQVARAD